MAGKPRRAAAPAAVTDMHTCEQILWINLLARGSARLQVLDLAEKNFPAEKCGRISGCPQARFFLRFSQILWTKLLAMASPDVKVVDLKEEISADQNFGRQGFSTAFMLQASCRRRLFSLPGGRREQLIPLCTGSVEKDVSKAGASQPSH